MFPRMSSTPPLIKDIPGAVQHPKRRFFAFLFPLGIVLVTVFFRTDRLVTGNAVILVQPAPQIHIGAAFRAKRAEFQDRALATIWTFLAKQGNRWRTFFIHHCYFFAASVTRKVSSPKFGSAFSVIEKPCCFSRPLTLSSRGPLRAAITSVAASTA